MVSTPRKISSPLRKVSAPRYGGVTESSMHFYHRWVTLFLFLVVIICVLCGYQGGLEPKRRVKDMDVSGDLTVDGLSKLNGGLQTLYPNGASAQSANFTAAAGYIYVITKADGCAVTLPAPTVGARIKLVFGAVTSNSHTITCDTATTLYNGYLLLADTADGTAAEHKAFSPDGTNDDVITFNGTTKGNSGTVELVGTATNRWLVSGLIHASGSVVTPFS